MITATLDAGTRPVDAATRPVDVATKPLHQDIDALARVASEKRLTARNARQVMDAASASVRDADTPGGKIVERMLERGDSLTSIQELTKTHYFTLETQSLDAQVASRRGEIHNFSVDDVPVGDDNEIITAVARIKDNQPPTPGTVDPVYGYVARLAQSGADLEGVARLAQKRIDIRLSHERNVKAVGNVEKGVSYDPEMEERIQAAAKGMGITIEELGEKIRANNNEVQERYSAQLRHKNAYVQLAKIVKQRASLLAERQAWEQKKTQAALPQVQAAVENLQLQDALLFDEGVLERPTPESIKRIMELVEIHGEPYQPLNRRLTSDYLREQGLSPAYQVKNRDAIMWFSQPYKIGERTAIVAYVNDTDGKIVARSYYQSQSQGGDWRYLPSYTIENGGFGWYSKGHQGRKSGNAETSLAVPFGVQKHLDIISGDGMSYVEPQFPYLVLAGTAREKPQRVGKEVGKTYQREVSEEPEKLNGNFYAGYGKVTPEQARFYDRAQKADFSKPPLASWSKKTDLYGETIVEVFPSHDKKLLHMWYRDKEGRAWKQVEDVTAPIVSTGLRREWVGGGDYVTPGFEYADHDGGYGNKANRRGYYVDMRNYLDRMPDTQEYRQNLAQRGIR